MGQLRWFIAALLLGASLAHADVLPPDMPRIRFFPDPFYNQIGYRMGFIDEFSQERWKRQEGSLLMGFTSSPTTIYDEECMKAAIRKSRQITDPVQREDERRRALGKCPADDNPWRFSMVNKPLYDRFSGGRTQPYANKGTPVLIYYRRESYHWLKLFMEGTPWTILMATTNFVKKIWPTGGLTVPVPRFYSKDIGESSTVPQVLLPKTFFISGRVVKASMDNQWTKTYELLVQRGPGGNLFAHLSVDSDDPDMFDHIVLAMRTGQFLNLGVIKLSSDWFAPEAQIRSVRGYHTPYRVISVEVIPDTPGRTVPAGAPLPDA